MKSFVATSTDGGRTFGAPVEIGAGVFDNAALRANALKTTTTTTPPGAVPTTTAPAAGSRAANPDQAANFGSRNPAMTVDRKGTLYVAWRYQTANITPAPERALFLSKSTDRGKTFTTTPITGFDNKVFQALPVLGWSPEGGSQGTLHLVDEGRPVPNNITDIWYRRSTDGGQTWSEPKTLNTDDPKKLVVHTLPTLTVAPNGRLDVVWWDQRNDPGFNFANDVYHTYSTDNGETWAAPDRRVTDRIVDRRIGVFGLNFDVTAPPALASSGNYIMVGWDDTRNATPGELGAGTTDLFTAAVQYKAIGASSSAARYALGAVAGLLGVGLILLLASRMTGRPGPRPAPIVDREKS
ncbi:MAG: sialidase family protein, partial [Acidimicrobiales bacterium]